jgi:D-serine dehydratase
VAPTLAARPDWRDATQVVWTTGGALLPEAEFQKALAAAG